MRNYLQPICFSDLTLVDSRLNGDACTGMVSGCIPGVSGIAASVNGSEFKMYFDFLTRSLNVELTEDGLFQLFDLSGRFVFRGFLTAGVNNVPIEKEAVRTGVLIGVISGYGSVYTGKVVVGY